jgi:hypothetical protein
MCYTGECPYETKPECECGVFVKGIVKGFPKDAFCEQPGFLDLPIVGVAKGDTSMDGGVYVGR